MDNFACFYDGTHDGRRNFRSFNVELESYTVHIPNIERRLPMVTHRSQAARLRVRGPVKHRLLRHSSFIAYYHYKTALYLKRVSKPPPKARYKPLACSNSKRLTASPIPIPSSSRVSQEPKTPMTVVRVSLNPRISNVHPPRGPSRGRVSPIVSSKSSSSVTLCPPHRRPQDRSGSRGGEGGKGGDEVPRRPRHHRSNCASRGPPSSPSPLRSAQSERS